MFFAAMDQAIQKCSCGNHRSACVNDPSVAQLHSANRAIRLSALGMRHFFQHHIDYFRLLDV